MRRRGFYLGTFSALLFVSACAEDIDTTRQVPKRGTLGEELFGVLCDRVASQALHEDLTASSFKAVCHKSSKGGYAKSVDQTQLPGPTEGAVDKNGKAVSVDQQKQNRAAAVARIEALARRRGDLIAALDATFPDIKVPVKDVRNADPTRSCDEPAGSASGERRFHDELSDMLGRFQDLYNDGTIPQSTESLATVMNAFKASPEAQAALARFDSRKGYRPIEVALGAARPIIAYPQLRDLSNASLSLISADSDPYALGAKKDELGRRIPTPGAAYPQFSKMLEVAYAELRATTADPPATPLGLTTDAVTGRQVLARPRQDLEILQELLYAQNPVFGGGAPRYIVKRDGRGYAQVALGNTGGVPAPFVDANKDGVPDVDDLGRFLTSTGAPPPTPFFTVDPLASTDTIRDAFGRALAGTVPVYEYIDTSHAFAASLLSDLKPLLNPNLEKKHETIMYVLAGAQVLFGARDGETKTTKSYSVADSDPVDVAYTAFHPESSGLIDLVYAFGQIFGDKTSDDTLAYLRALMAGQTQTVARVVGAGLAVKAIADKHPEAKIPAKSVLWDELLDVFAKTAKEPGLLEDIVRALGEDDSLALGPIFASYMKFNDRISYDRANLNGAAVNLTTGTADEMKTLVDRAKPDSGFNRSAFQRFSQLILETTGVTACNKEGAVVHVKGIPFITTLPLLGGTYKECEVFKIENLAAFYLDSIVGKQRKDFKTPSGELYFRPSLLRNGVAGFAAATVSLIEQSSGLKGFWDGPSAKTFRPQPQWLNRLVFFDLENDTTNADTHQFIADLNGPTIGTTVCPERVIDDPAPTSPDASPDGKVHGLRSCDDGDWLQQRGADTLFTWENFGFYKAIKPLLTAYANHDAENLFLEALSVLYRHWADDRGAATECRLSADPSTPFKTCGRDGAVSYEPLLAAATETDLMPALNDLSRILQTTTIKHCDETDSRTHACTKSTDADGLTVMAAAARAMLDQDYAKSIGLKDRQGKVTALRNDGTTVPQVTPMYLLTAALSAMDGAFDAYAASHPDDKDRQPMWRAARSQLVDQFLGVNGSGTNAAFANLALPNITPTLIDVLRAQLFAHCPASFSPPYPRCNWARDEMTTKLADVVKGPVFATSLDLLDAMRRDEGARTQLEALLTYLLTATSQNDALPAMLASTADLVQLLRDDANLVPLYHVLAEAVAASTLDSKGHVTKKSLIDANAALLARISGKAYDKNDVELCNKELDPNQILTVALSNLVTPMVADDGSTTQTPLEVIVDVIADVNRVAPAGEALQAADYANIADNVGDFLLNKERGLEQFYEIVRQGTVH